MFCSKCGSAIAANTAFCPACGNAVQPAIATAPTPAAPAGVMPAATAAAVSPHWLPPVTRAYAGFWLRFVAYLIDGILLGAVVMAIGIPLGVLSGLGGFLRSIRPDHPPDAAFLAALMSSIALWFVLAFLGGWLYFAYFESSEWQATLGKKALNLVVTDMEGNRVSFGRASGRYFGKLISGKLTMGVGYVLAGFTERKQALHDMIASCLVLRS